MAIADRAHDFERVIFASDEAAGLQAIVAIHSTKLGPALGGCRIMPYDTEDEALDDVLRLAESMTWKAAAAGLDLGGGKAVIVANPERDKSEALLRAFARVVESLGGRYIASVDVGSTSADLDEMLRDTSFVVGAAVGGSGDPSPITARGVAAAIRSCLFHVFRDPSAAGRRVAIQGAGKVGYHLAKILVDEGAEVVVADPNVDNLGRVVADLGVQTCTPDDILTTACDVLAPCALGGVLDEAMVGDLKCRIVCGSANNQLASLAAADALGAAEILYAPDFITNAGGLISVADELGGWSRDRVMARVDDIGRRLLDVINLAQASGTTTAEAAVAYAQQRIDTISALND